MICECAVFKRILVYRDCMYENNVPIIATDKGTWCNFFYIFSKNPKGI